MSTLNDLRLSSKQIINGSIRIFSLIIKSLFIIASINLLEKDSFIALGLVVANSAFYIIFFGLEFYRYCQRELSYNLEKRSLVYSNQFSTYIFFYLLFSIPIFLFSKTFLPINICVLLVAISITEHLSQEIYRILIFEELQIKGTILLFIRTSAWVIILFALYFIGFTIDLNLILILWLLFSIFSVTYGFFHLKKILIISFSSLNYRWIVKGLKFTSVIVLGSLSFRALLTFDRNLIEYFFNGFSAEYIFIVSIVNVFLVIIDSTVFSFNFPKILKSKSKNQIKLYINKSKKQVFLMGVLFILIANISYLIIQQIGIKPDYFINNGFIIISSFTIVVLCFSIIPNYILYKNNKDFVIAKINLFVLAVSCLFFYLIKSFGVYSINLSLLIAAILMLVLKTFFSKKLYG